jgi:hypothetical protein
MCEGIINFTTSLSASDYKRVISLIKRGQYARALLVIVSTRPITLEEAASIGLTGINMRNILCEDPRLKVARIDGVRCLTSRRGLQYELLKSSQFNLNRFYDHVIAPHSRNPQQCYGLMMLASNGDIAECVRTITSEGNTIFISASRFARAGLTPKEMKKLLSY